ncbi:Cysteine-rich repeat secretory protein 3 [Vitis vinifera]|uniref:Cysteine-rich repeat secretory protein 3 n=1 Tax=Vitis vinifera TaxID=29760 RepID=A0A438F117_VITVI|nr:Cysteine-rich repeat secretory protein 3 [Vitis vinifera]
MGLPPKPLFLLSLSLTFLTILGFFPSAKPSTDFTNLVYKGCADQKFQDPSGVYSKTLKPLFDSLVSQSSTKNFSTATSGEGQSSITGLYQCRGDLSNSQCYTCVGKLPDLCTKLCGKAIAARVQLSGCYMRYEVAGFKQVTATELLYKVCGSTQASQSGFEEKRDTTFGMMEKGVEGGDGFYTGHMSLFERVKTECGDSISGQIYLHKCYISYSYYPTGVPSQSSAESGQSTEKTVALVVGGVAALGFGIACLMFVRTAFKKHHSSKY